MALRMMISAVMMFALLLFFTRNANRDWTALVMWTLASQLPTFLHKILLPDSHSIAGIAVAMLIGVALVFVYVHNTYSRKKAFVITFCYIAGKILFHSLWRRFFIYSF